MTAKKLLLILLSVLLGTVFLVSGYTKLYPIEPFEYTFVDLGFINWQIAPFVARFMIGLEFFIGILLVLNLNLRKFAYKLGVGTLILFSIYLVLLLVFTGNKGNCGCFGSYIEMTPLQALLKNIVMLGLFYILNRWHTGWEIPKWNASATFSLLLLSFAMPFIINTVQLNYSEAYLNKPQENFKLELDTLYQYASLNTPPKTLSEGKHIIAFMSLTCPHCKIAANKIRIIHERNPNISFYFVLNGDTEKLPSFFEATHTSSIAHCILVGGKPINHFVYLAGTSMPAIYMVNNSMVEHVVNYMDLDQKELEKWYDKPKD